MALRKLNLPPAKAVAVNTMKLPPTSYNVGGTGRFKYKQNEMKAFAGWMAKRFKPDVEYGEFELAEAMGVHRCIADDWLSSLVQFDMVTSVILKKPLLDLQALAFYIPKKQYATYDRTVALDLSELQGFDPWTDRSLDGIVWMADNPHMFCDKFYTSDHHEHYLVKGGQRIRPNKTMFRPMLHADILALSEQYPPHSKELRAAIDNGVSGIKTMARPT